MSDVRCLMWANVGAANHTSAHLLFGADLRLPTFQFWCCLFDLDTMAGAQTYCKMTVADIGFTIC
jgi:hypothetical protein